MKLGERKSFQSGGKEVGKKKELRSLSDAGISNDNKGQR